MSAARRRQESIHGAYADLKGATPGPPGAIALIRCALSDGDAPRGQDRIARRGRVIGKVCSMVCAYDKVKVGQIAVAVLAAHVLRKRRPRDSI